MTEQDLIHKIEWVNKRCSLKGEPLTQSQIELLKFVFADTVVNKISSNPMLSDRLPNSEDVKRWYQLLVGKSEIEMQKDIEATLR